MKSLSDTTTKGSFGIVLFGIQPLKDIIGMFTIIQISEVNSLGWLVSNHLFIPTEAQPLLVSSRDGSGQLSHWKITVLRKRTTPYSCPGMVYFFILINLHCPGELMLHMSDIRWFCPKTCDGRARTSPSITPAFCWTTVPKPYRHSSVPTAQLKPVSCSCPQFMPQWPVLLAKPKPWCRQDEAQPKLSAPARENSLCWSMEREWPFMGFRLQKHELLLGL